MRHIAFFGIQLHGNDADMLRGVFRYALEHTNWMLHDPCMPGEWSTNPEDRPSGIIANIINADTAAYCATFQVPLVNICAPLPGIHTFPTVSADPHAIGRMAARHFLDRGLRHLGWFDHMLDFPFIGERGEGFEAAARENGVTCSKCRSGLPPRECECLSTAQPVQTAIEWLRSLPRPCGVFATTDVGGRKLCHLCRRLGLHVPEDIAIVGVDDFEFICETTHPPLSSIRLPNADIGYKAAELLDRLMSRRGKVPAQMLFQPLDVHVRQSSDIIAVEDRLVARALAFIRIHAAEHLDVTAVVRDSGLNRRALERRFHDALGRTVLHEIHLARVALAQQLLTDTELTVGEIATRSGFHDAQQLGLAFRKTLGIPPSECRKKARRPEVR